MSDQPFTTTPDLFATNTAPRETPQGNTDSPAGPAAPDEESRQESSAEGVSPENLCGSGVIAYVDPTTDLVTLVPTLCHRWSCERCAWFRVLRIRSQIQGGRPQRMLTLTLRPDSGRSTAASIDFIRLNWRRLVQRIRRNYPRLEYIAAVELTKNGTPHLHILTRGDYIPQSWLSKAWCQLTRSYIVHIRYVSSIHGGLKELTKYLTKTAAQVADLRPNTPVITKSRRWLPDDWQEPYEAPPNAAQPRFLKLSLTYALGLVEELGGSVQSDPLSRHKWTIQFSRPPDSALVAECVSIGSWAEAEFAILLSHLYSPGGSNPQDLEDDLDWLCCDRSKGEYSRPCVSFATVRNWK